MIVINYIRIVRNVKNLEEGPRLATCHQYAARNCMTSGITSLKPSEMDIVIMIKIMTIILITTTIIILTTTIMIMTMIIWCNQTQY